MTTYHRFDEVRIDWAAYREELRSRWSAFSWDDLLELKKDEWFPVDGASYDGETGIYILHKRERFKISPEFVLEHRAWSDEQREEMYEAERRYTKLRKRLDEFHADEILAVERLYRTWVERIKGREVTKE